MVNMLQQGSIWRGRTAVLLALVLVSTVIFAVVVVGTAAENGLTLRSFQAGAQTSSVLLFRSIPAIAAMCLGIAPDNRDLGMRAIFLAFAATTVLLILLLFGGVAGAGAGLGAVGGVDMSTALDALGYAPSAAEGTAAEYPLNDPRVLQLDLLLLLCQIASPFATLGVSAGVIRWIGERVTFRTTTDHWIALVVVLLVLLPLGYGGFLAILRDAAADRLFGSGSLFRLFMAAFPLFLVGGAGWASLFVSRSGGN